jgi:hypothetical protein
MTNNDAVLCPWDSLWRTQNDERGTLNDKIGFVFSNCTIATKPLRHKGAKILMSLRGPKGRGNLLHHWQKALFALDIGFVWLCFSTAFKEWNSS